MLSDGELTDKEISKCVKGTPAYRATQFDREIAHAAARKMAWWILGDGKQLRNLGFEPWPDPEPTGEGD